MLLFNMTLTFQDNENVSLGHEVPQCDADQEFTVCRIYDSIFALFLGVTQIRVFLVFSQEKAVEHSPEIVCVSAQETETNEEAQRQSVKPVSNAVLKRGRILVHQLGILEKQECTVESTTTKAKTFRYNASWYFTNELGYPTLVANESRSTTRRDAQSQCRESILLLASHKSCNSNSEQAAAAAEIRDFLWANKTGEALTRSINFLMSFESKELLPYFIPMLWRSVLATYNVSTMRFFLLALQNAKARHNEGQ